jgi:hypothetical protein
VASNVRLSFTIELGSSQQTPRVSFRGLHSNQGLHPITVENQLYLNLGFRQTPLFSSLQGHRNYGNRWTEIAKLVPGRTDNAVKNRYCALAKKMAEGDKPGKRKRRKRATIEHKAPEGLVAPYHGAILRESQIETQVLPQEGNERNPFNGQPRTENGGVKRKSQTAYERQRSSESFVRRDSNAYPVHWQPPSSSRGDNPGRYRPPQSVEQRAHALVAELLGGSAQMKHGMDTSAGDFAPENYGGGAYQRMLLMGEGNDAGGPSDPRNVPHPSYYEEEGYDSRNELGEGPTWYTSDEPGGGFPEYEHEFHPGSANRNTPAGSLRAHKRGRMPNGDEMHPRSGSHSSMNARMVYDPQGGGQNARPKASSRPPSLKSSPVGKGSRHYPTQLQHALASIQRAKSQKISPGKLATEQASRVKRKYTRREQGGLKIVAPDDAMVTRVEKGIVRRGGELEMGGSPSIRDEMQHQPKRPRPSLSIHIPRTSGSNPSSPQGDCLCCLNLKLPTLFESNDRAETASVGDDYRPQKELEEPF